MRRVLPILIMLVSTAASAQQVLDSIIDFSITHTVNKDSLVIGKVFFTYDNQSRVIERLKSRTDDLINWYPAKRRQYVYDSRGRVEKRCNDSFYVGTQTWKRFKCDSFGYLDNSDTMYRHIKMELSGKPAKGIVSNIEYAFRSNGDPVHLVQLRLDGSNWVPNTADSFLTSKSLVHKVKEHKQYSFDPNNGPILKVHDIDYINPVNPFMDKLDSNVRISYGTTVIKYINRYNYYLQDSLMTVWVKTINVTNNVSYEFDSSCYHMRTATTFDSLLQFYYQSFDSSFRLNRAEYHTYNGSVRTSMEQRASGFTLAKAEYDQKTKLRAFDTVFYRGPTRQYLDRWAFDKNDRIKAFTRYDFGSIDDSLKVRTRSHYFYGDLFTRIPEPTIRGLSVFPNPSNGLVSIELNEESPIQVFNQLGQEVFMAAGSRSYRLSLLNPGVYIVTTPNSRQKLVIK